MIERIATYSEDDLIPLSALQHYMFCPRQCALIHLEHTWEDNRFTVEGKILHERVDAGGSEKRRNVRLAFGLPIRSLRLGLSGKADMVEFHLGPDGLWTPYPVEKKRGCSKEEDWDRVQLCAQALCLEEMLDLHVPEGALFYEKERRRERVLFDESLRRRTEQVAAAVHSMFDRRATPLPGDRQRCRGCSLLSRCLPKSAGDDGGVARYYARILELP